MSATTSVTHPHKEAVGRPVSSRSDIKPIPMTRLIAVELSKMFDTRAGFWLVMSVGIMAALATVATIAFAPDSAIAYGTFGAAVGVPVAVLLPIIAILSVTSEYGQRTALTTYALVPRRGRIIVAKAVAALAIGVAGVVVSLSLGALGNVVGAAIVGIDPVWNFSWRATSFILLANLLGMAIGFMLGVLIRNTPGAIVGYFVYSLVLPGIFGTLAAFQQWFADLQPWVDINFATGALYADVMTSEAWQQLGVTSLIWVFIPLVIGLRFVMRAEVK